VNLIEKKTESKAKSKEVFTNNESNRISSSFNPQKTGAFNKMEQVKEEEQEYDEL